MEREQMLEVRRITSSGATLKRRGSSGSPGSCRRRQPTHRRDSHN